MKKVMKIVLIVLLVLLAIIGLAWILDRYVVDDNA